MKATVPASRAALTFAQYPVSRIPHLQHHIRVRQSPCKPAKSRDSKQNQPQRWINTTAPLRKLSPTFFGDTQLLDPASTLTTEGNQEYSGDAEIAQATSNPPEKILDILKEGHPDRVFFALLDPNIGHDFIRNADNATFDLAFTAIDPAYFIEPMKTEYRFMKESLSQAPKYRRVRHIGERFKDFADKIETIITKRQDAGHKYSLEICRHLLLCAKVMGNARTAKAVLWKVMPENNIRPDLACYNYFMEACCWSHAWAKGEQWRLRVTPRVLAIRGMYNRPPDLKGHRVGRGGNGLGLRYGMLNLFKKMVGEGHKGDEATFTNLMVAMGRENDLNGVKSVLRSVYNIDVDLLSQVDEEEAETPTYYDEDSPLRPSSRLLFTVAHVFGSNNEAGLAIQLVDFISRQYNLPIPFAVWLQLFEWTFVLQLHRSQQAIRQGQRLGRVSEEILERLWIAMTDEPHSIEPDITMLTIRARAQRGALDLEETMSNIGLAREKLASNRKQLQRDAEDIVSWIKAHNSILQGPSMLPAEWYGLRRAFITNSLSVDRDLQLLIVAFRGIFKEFRWTRRFPRDFLEETDKQARREKYKEWNSSWFSRAREWEQRILPSLLEKYSEFFPNGLVYKTTGGHISVNARRNRNRVIREQWGDQLRKVGIIRALIDTDDYGQMVEGMAKVPKAVEEAETFCFRCKKMGHVVAGCPTRLPSSGVASGGGRIDAGESILAEPYFVMDEVLLRDRPAVVEYEFNSGRIRRITKQET